jgi:hypothetical protein
MSATAMYRQGTHGRRQRTFLPAVSSAVVMSLMPEASMCFKVATGICPTHQAGVSVTERMLT